MLTSIENALFVVAAILGNVVSVTLFDILVLFTEIIDHEHGLALTMGKSKDGSAQWHWEMDVMCGDAESLARVGLAVSKHNDPRGRGLRAEQFLIIVRCSLNFVVVAFGKDPLSSQDC